MSSDDKTRTLSSGSKPTRLAGLILMSALTGCTTFTPLQRNLPPQPVRLTQAPPIPALDSACHFPWFAIEGCRGKNEAAMLRLTVSDDLALRQRLAAMPAWYEGVRRSYGSKQGK